jgi:hypothetical protein
MQWFPFTNDQADENHLCRFGHVAVRIDARDVWGTELIVVFGGVVHSLPNESTSARDDQHAAIADVDVLNVETSSWFKPSMNPDASHPEPRAFHSAVSLGSTVYIFGGHVLQFDATQNNKKKRIFFSDIWSLGTVSTPVLLMI